MARPSKTDQEIGFIRDAWTELRTLEAEYHTVISCYVTPQARPGCFRFRLVCVPLMDDAPSGLGTQAVEWTFPSASDTSLAGELWRQSIKLSRQVYEADEKRAFGKKLGG